jgi:hypothetical protein
MAGGGVLNPVGLVERLEPAASLGQEVGLLVEELKVAEPAGVTADQDVHTGTHREGDDDDGTEASPE